jgi:small subunit ribosomal protein S5
MMDRNRKRKGPNRRRDNDRVAPPPVEWKPVTKLGKIVKAGEITDIAQIFDQGLSILESEIVDHLLPGLEEDLLLIGQAKGKFGGGQRRIFRQTQKKTREGNKIHFMTCAVVGNRDGYVGIATGKSKETVPARDKSKRKARLNLMRIRRGSGSWETDSTEANSIPFAVEGKCGSVRIRLMPAPPGKGLCIEKECAKILSLAGIKDIWSQTIGQTKTKLNLVHALIDALKKLSEVRTKPGDVAKLGIVEGKLQETEQPEEIKPVEDPAEISEKVAEEPQEKATPAEETVDESKEKAKELLAEK